MDQNNWQKNDKNTPVVPMLIRDSSHGRFSQVYQLESFPCTLNREIGGVNSVCKRRSTYSASFQSRPAGQRRAPMTRW